MATDQKKDTPTPLQISLSRCALTIRETCGQCMHFKRMAYPSYKKVCSELGILDVAKPCQVFMPDASLVRFTNPNYGRDVAIALKELNPRELRLMAAIFNQEERTRNKGFHFGQIVYFRAFGGDYISNYVKARVISASRDYVHIQGFDGCTASLYAKSIMTFKQFRKKEMELLKANKINDPNRAKYTTVPTKAERKIKSIIDKTLPDKALMLTENTKTTNVLQKGGARKVGLSTPIDKLLQIRGQ